MSCIVIGVRQGARGCIGPCVCWSQRVKPCVSMHVCVCWEKNKNKTFLRYYIYIHIYLYIFIYWDVCVVRQGCVENEGAVAVCMLRGECFVRVFMLKLIV